MNDKLKKIIEDGGTILSAAVGGGIGFIVGGPVGAAAGSVVSVAITRVGKEISSRFLSPREEIRIGDAINIAVTSIKQRIEKGESVRNDDFFSEEGNGKCKADEVLENMLLKCQREPQEKKIKYIANLYANIVFDKNISAEMAHQLIKYAEVLTYRQFQIMQLCALLQTTSIFNGKLRNNDYRNQSHYPVELRQLLYEYYGLCKSDLIMCGSTISLGVTDIAPGQARLNGLGADLYNYANLKDIPQSELNEIISVLK